MILTMTLKSEVALRHGSTEEENRTPPPPAPSRLVVAGMTHVEQSAGCGVVHVEQTSSSVIRHAGCKEHGRSTLLHEPAQHELVRLVARVFDETSQCGYLHNTR